MPAIVFVAFALLFPLAITHAERISKPIDLTIGRLNAEDIRQLEPAKRNDLCKQVACHFVAAAVVTVSVGILFIVFGDADNAALILPCLLTETAAGLTVALRVTKKANALKNEL